MTGVLFLAAMLAVIGALDWLGAAQVEQEIKRKLEAEETARRGVVRGTCPDGTTPVLSGSEQWCSTSDVEDPASRCEARP